MSDNSADLVLNPTGDFHLEVAPWQKEAIEAFVSDKYQLHLYAGARESGKSNIMYTELEMIFRGLLGDWKANILLLRATKESAKKTIFHGTIGKVLSQLGIDYHDLEQKDVTRGMVTINGHLVRIDSFVADSMNKDKLKGYEGVTHVFVEELAEVLDFGMFDQLFKTVNRRIEVKYVDPETGENKTYVTKGKIICAFNTPPKNHWLITQYYDLEPHETLEGFYYLKPKTGIIENNEFGLRYEDRQIFYSFSTVYDNSVLRRKIIDAEGERGWHIHLLNNHEMFKQTDPFYYYTTSLGLVASGRSGQIFTGWKSITLEEYNQIEYKPFYGIDFGYSEDPSAVVEVKHIKSQEYGQRDKLYVRLLIYEKGLLNPLLAAKIKEKVPSYGYSQFYADHKPDSVDALISYGIQNIQKAKKSTGGQERSRLTSITHLLGYEVYYVQDERVEREIEKYHWLMNKQDPTKSLNEPSDGDDHFIDAFKYAVYTRFHPSNVSDYENFLRSYFGEEAYTKALKVDN